MRCSSASRAEVEVEMEVDGWIWGGRLAAEHSAVDTAKDKLGDGGQVAVHTIRLSPLPSLGKF